jgi:hypothetical protein
MARLHPSNRAQHPHDSPLKQLRSGWAEFTRVRWLWLLTGQWSVFSLIVLAPVAVLGPEIALHNLGGPAAWGLINSCLAMGAAGGQLATGKLKLPARPGVFIAWLTPVMTGEALALGLNAPLPIVAAVTAVSGVAFGIEAVMFATAMQTSIRPNLLSRVAAIDLLASEGGQPLGYTLAGPIGQAVGPHVVLAAAAISMLIASLAFPFVRALRDEREPRTAPAADDQV